MERQVSYVPEISGGADSQRISWMMICRMVVWCMVMLFPYGLFSYMPEKKGYSAWWKNWVSAEYDGRNKRVEEYLNRIMLFGKVLKGQSWKEPEKVYGKDENWTAIRVRLDISGSTYHIAASTKFQFTGGASHHLHLMDRYFRYFSCMYLLYLLFGEWFNTFPYFVVWWTFGLWLWLDLKGS